MGSYTLGCLKCYVFKININVSTCIAHAYCLLNDHRFRTLNSPSICAEKKDNDIIDNIVFVMGAFFHCPDFLNQLRAFILWCFLNKRGTCFKEPEHALLMINKHYFLKHRFANTTPTRRLQKIIN